MMILILWACAALPAFSDIVLKTVSPADFDSFPSAAYLSTLNTFSSSPSSILSIQPDTITGLEARRTYFPNITGIYSFQLLHITRVSAMVPTNDNSITMARLQRDLSSACVAAGIGIVAIDTASDPPQGNWLTNLPPSVIITLAAGWAFTALACGGGWLIFCMCCRAKDEETLTVSETPTAQILQPTAPPPMRLPDELIQSAYRCDQYVTPENSGGPCAIRLVSLYKHPTPTRP